MTAFDPLMEIPAPKPERLLADKGYDADRIRQSLLSDNIEPVIPPRSNRKEHIHCDFRAYRDRNQVERLFNRLKQNRRIATRYDKTKLSFEAFLTLAALKDWMRTFVNTAYKYIFYYLESQFHQFPPDPHAVISKSTHELSRLG